MNFDYVSLRRLERFFTDLKGWLSSKYATKEPMKGATAQSAGEAGLVPAPAVADKDKYLKGDGTWGTVPEAEKNYSYVWDGSPTGEVTGMFHVTVNRDLSGYSSAQRVLTQVGRNGALGYLLPEAVNDTIPVGITDAGNHKTYALKTPAQLGLLNAPTPTSSDANKVLIVDQNGTPGWNLLNSMTGSTASAAGTSGLVPAPAAGDEDKVLKGDGTWGEAGSSVRVSYDAQAEELHFDFYAHTNEVLIGDRWYKTVTIGNQIWLAENLDYKFCNIGVFTW